MTMNEKLDTICQPDNLLAVFSNTFLFCYFLCQVENILTVSLDIATPDLQRREDSKLSVI